MDTDGEHRDTMEGVKNFLANWFNTKETEETEEEEMDSENCVAAENAVEAVENVEDTQNTSEVCKFYLENKCRFGDHCKNRHEGEPAEKVFKKDTFKNKAVKNMNDRSKKKPPMKTAADVIKRIQWDPMLPKVKSYC